MYIGNLDLRINAMNIRKFVCTGISALFVSLGVNAQEMITGPELVVTATDSGALNIDYVNDSKHEITALMYSIDIGDALEAQVDLSNCVAGLPTTHIGFCKYNPGVVKVVIYSGSNAPLQVANIGSISVSGELSERGPRVGSSSSDARGELSGRASRGFLTGRESSQGNAGLREGNLGGADELHSVRVKDAIFSRTDGTDVSGTVHQ